MKKLKNEDFFFINSQSWEQDYHLQDPGRLALFDEYLEMSEFFFSLLMLMLMMMMKMKIS
jgi:hypothetical protein